MLTLNTVFKQVYGEALEPLGFVKIKGRHPHFVRLIGDEIIHIITYRNVQCTTKGYKEFVIDGGVATVYRQSIDLTRDINSNWFRSNAAIYGWLHPFDCDYEYRKSIFTFTYKADDEDSLLCEVKHSLEVTAKIMLPTLNEVTTLEACIEYHHKLNMSMNIYDDEDFGNKNGNNFYNEGLLYIKTNNHDDFKEKTKKSLARLAHRIETGMIGGSYEHISERYEESRLCQVTRRDNIYNNPELYAKALAELERRKLVNTETLRSYGFNI